jgi:dTDP-4-dehydrorhamnose 3,5-epimerase
MNLTPTELPDVLLIEPKVFGDARGFFKELYHHRRYAEAGLAAVFVQDNYSRSQRGTLRGLHFQLHHPQGKLIQVLQGEIYDVAVDLRRDSPTFGRWTAMLLSAENHRQLYVPAGFGHGFYVTSESADVLYKCTDYYYPEHERTLIWNDSTVGVTWPLQGEPLLSAKDQAGLPLGELECFATTPKM